MDIFIVGRYTGDDYVSRNHAKRCVVFKKKTVISGWFTSQLENSSETVLFQMLMINFCSIENANKMQTTLIILLLYCVLQCFCCMIRALEYRRNCLFEIIKQCLISRWKTNNVFYFVLRIYCFVNYKYVTANYLKCSVQFHNPVVQDTGYRDSLVSQKSIILSINEANTNYSSFIWMKK